MTAVEQCLSLRRLVANVEDAARATTGSPAHYSVVQARTTYEPHEYRGTMEAGRDHDASRERLYGDSGMRGTKNLPTIHFSAHVLDHVLQVSLRFRTIAD
jgi:hypothetical protein